MMAAMHLPSDDATELDWLLFKQSGLVTWAQAVALLSPGKVRQLVAAAGPGAVLRGLAAARRAPDLLGRLPMEMPAVFVRRTRYLPGGGHAPPERHLGQR
jgi:hypothetical protein